MSESVLYGRNAVREALRGPRAVRELLGEPRALEALEPGLRERAGGVQQTGRRELEQLAGVPDHQGLVARVEPYRYADADALLAADDALVVVLDQVQDPQNLGAVCRTAECAGAAGVVIPERRAAAITPAVCRASAGAVEHLPVARVVNVAAFLERAKERGAWVYGAAAESQTPYTQVDWSGRAVLVLGSEEAGLRPLVRARCDRLVSIPLAGRIESLNVSAAAAAILFEAARGRRDSFVPHDSS